MRAKLGWGLLWGAIVVSCVAGHSRKAAAGNCALYARAVTGIDLYGAAGGWWYEAAGRYQRGQMPAVGSILVFRPTGGSPWGHVAVVSKIVGPSMVLVDQSNWYHGRVTLGTPVADTSPNHDWTTVAVMNVDSGQFGRDNPTFGFIYPQVSGQAITTVATAGFQPPLAAARTTYDPSEQAGLFHFAVTEDDRYSGSRRWAHRRSARYSPRFAAASHRHGHSGWHSHPSERATHHTRTADAGRHPHSYRVASGG
ncbi:MAG: CHAP domain-containing protein [Stellaceae bacterium]